MKFTQSVLEGAYVIEIDKIQDERGFFARGWCQDELGKYNLTSKVVQLNIGANIKRGTIRGMHFQSKPKEEAKLVRCTKGGIYDVIIDLRENSPTHKHWFGVELTAENYKMIYVPEGFAHGYQTLTDHTEIYYLTSQYYAPELASGVRFDDPAFAILWPLPVEIISRQDKNWPLYSY